MRKHQAGLIDGKAWCARLLRALALVAAVFSQLDAGYAQQAAPELPTEPILRIEAGQHVAQIMRIDTDAANKFAVTASDDKTVRVWSLPDGQLQRVLRLPIDYGNNRQGLCGRHLAGCQHDRGRWLDGTGWSLQHFPV